MNRKMKKSTTKIFNESGKGYWMEGFGCIRAEGENRPSRPGHIVLGCDVYNFKITGDIACNINATSCDSAGHSGPSLLILNDQGGDVMNVDENVTSTLRAQDHGHPPIVCMGFDVYNMQDTGKVSKTLNAIRSDSDHVPVVCLNFQGSKSNNVVTDDGKCYSLNAMHGHDVHVVCFEPGILRRDCSAGNRAYIDICSTLRAQMGDNQPAVCYETK